MADGFLVHSHTHTRALGLLGIVGHMAHAVCFPMWAQCVAQVVWINLNDSPSGEVGSDSGLKERDKVDYHASLLFFLSCCNGVSGGFIPSVALCRFFTAEQRFSKCQVSPPNAIEKVFYYDFGFPRLDIPALDLNSNFTTFAPLCYRRKNCQSLR
jgi:hypothetical protein